MADERYDAMLWEAQRRSVQQNKPHIFFHRDGYSMAIGRCGLMWRETISELSKLWDEKKNKYKNRLGARDVIQRSAAEIIKGESCPKLPNVK